MADPIAPMTPLQAATDRLSWEAVYVRDLLHVTRGSMCHVSRASLQRLFEGLAAVMDLLAQAQGTVVTGGVTAPPAPGGG